MYDGQEIKDIIAEADADNVSITADLTWQQPSGFCDSCFTVEETNTFHLLYTGWKNQLR